MTAIESAKGTGWGAAIDQRRKALLQRIASATACAIVFTPILGATMTLGWLLVFLVIQGLEHAALHSVAASGPQRVKPLRAALGLAALTASGVVFGSLSIALWREGGLMGGVCATAMVCGGALYSTLNATGSRRVLIATATPQFVYLLAGPLYMIRLGVPQPYWSAVLVAGVSFTLYCLWTWRLMNRMRASETRARVAAETALAGSERRLAAQTAFLSTVGHDLRTPISAILTGAAELERSAMDSQARANASLIAEAGLMMKAMLDDLLDQAKLDAGRMTVEAEPLNLRHLLAHTARFWRGAAGDKGLKLKLDAGRGTPQWVRGDAMRLRQILNNLISNALKFTEAGHILIRVRSWSEADDRIALLIDVEDTGPGMTPMQVDRLFTAFDENNAAVAHRHGGTGLGLSISRELATLMGGRLTARSRAGEGSTFTLALTLAPSEAVERPLEMEAQIDHRAAVARALRPAPIPAAAPTPPEPGETTPIDAADAAVEPEPAGEADERALRVLVVDDHEINRRAIQLILAPLGAEVTQAADGMAALTAAANEAFDIIFMDVRMPELDGRETTRRLRAGDGPNAATPVIAVTADTQQEDVEACLAAGMTLFVSKPLTPGSLLGALTEALSPAGQPEAEAA